MAPLGEDSRQAIGTGPKIVAGWLPYWDVNADRTGGRAAPIIEANQDLFNEVDLFWNHLSASGKGIVVTSSVNAAKGEAAIARLSGQGYKLMMTSTDGRALSTCSPRLGFEPSWDVRECRSGACFRPQLSAPGSAGRR